MDFQEFADNFDTIGPSLAMELMRLDKEKEKEKKASEDNTKPSSSKLGARMLAERNQHGKKTKNRNNHDSDWIDKRVSNKEDRRKASIETEATVENSLTPQSPQEKDEKSTARTNRKKSFAKNVALPSGSVNAASPMSSVTLSQSPLKSKRDKWDRRKETALYEGYSSDSEDSDREEDKKIPAKATSQTNISEARAGKPILNLPWMKKKLQKQEDSDSSSSGWSDAEETPPIAIRKKGDRRDSQSSKTESRFDQKKSPEPKMDSSEESPHLESPGEIPHTKREASSSESPRASEESLRETPQASKESHGAKKESSSEQKKSPNKSSKEKASKRPSKCAEQRNRRRDAKNPLICDEKKRNEFENSREDIAKRQQFEHQRGVEDLWTDDEGASQNQGGPIQGLEVDAERVDKIYEDLLTGFDNSVSRFDDHDDSSDEENDQMDTEWEGIPHPNLKRPIFGPFNERGPLVLSEEEQHEVPFALNRYLLDYQQEGIRFLYRSIVEGEGCILADDMGVYYVKFSIVITIVKYMDSSTNHTFFTFTGLGMYCYVKFGIVITNC